MINPIAIGPTYTISSEGYWWIGLKVANLHHYGLAKPKGYG